MKTFGEKVIEWNENLHYDGKLPEGFTVLNPFLENPETMTVMKKFYNRFYHDNNCRKLILGINPGRHGAAVTGIPFTDTKRLSEFCGIEMHSARSHEISSVFIYRMIAAYGGTKKFYDDFYINSPFPLAIIRNKNGKQINANYYDDAALFREVEPFMIKSIRSHIALGTNTENVFVLGRKNADFIRKINNREHFFEKLTVLEHPRYIQQYKSRYSEEYITRYLSAFAENQ